MNARDIPECINSIKALNIDKVWFRGYTEKQLEKEIDKFIRNTSYSHYIIVSDDVIVTQQALDNLLLFNSQFDVITGWCNMFPEVFRANLELEPNIKDSYKFIRNHLPNFLMNTVKAICKLQPFKYITWKIVVRHFPDEDLIWNNEKVFRTYFVGWALTSMTRYIWLKYGFHYPEWSKKAIGSDAETSRILNDNSIPMYCARDSFIYHLASKRHFIIGQVKPTIIFEKQESIYDQDYIRVSETI